MQVKKRYPLWGMILWTKKYLIYFLIIDTIPVLLHHNLGLTWLMIPWQPIAVVGIAVSFYLGFKNNASYDRLWEARKIWGGIVNSSRTFTIMVRDFITNEFAETKVSTEELDVIHKTIVHRHIAWLKSLTYQLREERTWEHHSDKKHEELRKIGGVHKDEDHFEKIKPYVTSQEHDYIMSKGNKASHIISLQSKNLKELKFKGLIDNFRHMELEKMLGEFYTLQGKSERIKNFPFPRQYASVNYYFVWIFIFLLPIGMLNVFNSSSDEHFIFLAIPFTMLVSWVFILMELIGEYSENPFEGLFNDVPITSMATGIEIDIRQMLEETDLPEKEKPIGELGVIL